jgi:hypothetical protein
LNGALVKNLLLDLARHQHAQPKKGQGLMDKKEKRKLSESDICDLFISPAIRCH